MTFLTPLKELFYDVLNYPAPRSCGYAAFKRVQQDLGYVPYNHRITSVVPLSKPVDVYALGLTTRRTSSPVAWA